MLVLLDSVCLVLAESSRDEVWEIYWHLYAGALLRFDLDSRNITSCGNMHLIATRGIPAKITAGDEADRHCIHNDSTM